MECTTFTGSRECSRVLHQLWQRVWPKQWLHRGKFRMVPGNLETCCKYKHDRETCIVWSPVRLPSSGVQCGCHLLSLKVYYIAIILGHYKKKLSCSQRILYRRVPLSEGPFIGGSLYRRGPLLEGPFSGGSL